jgi:hypothetical protein
MNGDNEIRNHQVVGSTPISGSILSYMPQPVNAQKQGHSRFLTVATKEECPLFPFAFSF